MKYILKQLQSLDNLITYIFSNLSKEDEFVKKFFGNKKIILFDVGANLGGFTDTVIKNTHLNEAHIFEPSKKCYDYLKRKYKNKKFYFINKALSNKNKIEKFYENEILSQSSLHRKKNKFNSNLKNINTYRIKCTTLDKYYLDNNEKFIIDLLKIDAEGEDLKILKGCNFLLKKNKIKLIKIELLNTFNQKNISNLNEIIFFLQKYNYYLVTITKTKFVNEELLMMDAYFCKKKFFNN